MPRNLDAVLDQLDRYEARLDATKCKLVRLVEQRIGGLKKKVKQVRKHILRDNIPQLGNNPLPSDSTISYQDYLAAKSANQESSTVPIDVPAIPLTSRKRSRGQPTRRSGSRQRPKTKANTKDSTEDDTNEKGYSKVNIVRLNCTQEDGNFSTQTRDELLRHQNSVHKLDPFRCHLSACGDRFKSKYILYLHNFACY